MLFKKFINLVNIENFYKIKVGMKKTFVDMCNKWHATSQKLSHNVEVRNVLKCIPPDRKPHSAGSVLGVVVFTTGLVADLEISKGGLYMGPS